ncbi:hypothetical protein BKN38_03380 [Helicobacter sp. CLO-3]|uniref:hypothetical protein n=1 Tax=unclassified Helicobacter TaxID=2593540 RepID=UPI00080482C1|nr:MULTISPECIES: hypothetical protein [unclassified Helicobacter]OBV28495.1 hypothetical protein BA723_01965 [Helicobacter sp. CLO-3]OHU84192.1 hypothetical protein BKN38_03380 [Helicobacter sp. CLO-3]
MRIDYGLSTTSLSSILDIKQESTKRATSEDEAQDAKDSSAKNSSTNASQNLESKSTKKAAKIEQITSTKKSQESTESATLAPKTRQTFGLGILEQMSDEEYEIFERASAGMSEVEKMAAAQTLYVFTESYQAKAASAQDKSQQNGDAPNDSAPNNNMQNNSAQNDEISPSANYTGRTNKPVINPKNPYFIAQKDFIERYKALYNGAQEVNALI